MRLEVDWKALGLRLTASVLRPAPISGASAGNGGNLPVDSSLGILDTPAGLPSQLACPAVDRS